MDLNDIQELIKFVAKSGATEVDLEMENIKISIKSPPKKKRGEKDEPVIPTTPTIIQQVPALNTNTVVDPVNTPDKIINHDSKSESINEENNYITIKSSMIGTFYRSSSPEKPPFVNVGDNIKIGDTICIIEAMKLFNEIETEISGKVIKVLVDDASPIEFDQPLFLIDPS